MTWISLLGWCGSALLIYSVMQARVLRFRLLNLAACVVLAGFNLVLGIIPMVAMNLALCAINLWHLRILVASRHDSQSYAVLEVGGKDEYLRHLLSVHRDDIAAFQPDLTWAGTDIGDLSFVIQRGDEAVGIVLLSVHEGTAQVCLDYVTPRYRDFSPGRFLWHDSGVLAGRAIRRVVTSTNMLAPYYQRLGFTDRGDGSFELRIG